MEITIIIPNYKPGNYLWECLDSLESQTFDCGKFETILVLNGCNEPYKSSIKAYLAKHPKLNVNFIQTDTPGVSNARNIALDAARGKFVTFVDDDDFVSPTYLERLYETAQPERVSASNTVAFMDETKTCQEYWLSRSYRVLSPKGTVSSCKARRFFSAPWMKLIPMSFIQGRRYDVRFRNKEDSLFMFLISDKIKTVSFTSEDAVYYRRVRQESATTRKRSFGERICNNFRVAVETCRIWYKSPRSYSFFLFVTKHLGIIKSTILRQG